MEFHVGSEVEDCAIKDDIIGKGGYLVPRVTCEELGVSYAQLCVGGCREEGGKGARVVVRAWGVLSNVKVEAVALLELRGRSFKEIGDVLAWSPCELSKVNACRGLCTGDVVDITQYADCPWDCADPDETLVRILGLWTEDLLETDRHKADDSTEKGDNEAEGDLFSPSLANGLVLEATEGAKEEIWSPEGDDPRKNAP